MSYSGLLISCTFVLSATMLICKPVIMCLPMFFSSLSCDFKDASALSVILV